MKKLIILITLVFLLLVPSVSADWINPSPTEGEGIDRIINLSYSETQSTSYQPVSGGTTYGGGSVNSPLLRFKDIDSLPFISTVLYRSTYGGSDRWNTNWVADDYIGYGTTTCEFRDTSNNLLGTGSINYNIDYSLAGTPKAIIIWFDFNPDWNIGSRTGRTDVKVVYDPAKINNLVIYDTGQVNKDMNLFPGVDNFFVGIHYNFNDNLVRNGLYIVNVQKLWKNDLIYDFRSDKTYVSVIRNSYFSRAVIKDSNITYRDDYSTRDITNVIVYDSPIMIDLTDNYNNLYSRTVNNPFLIPITPFDLTVFNNQVHVNEDVYTSLEYPDINLLTVTYSVSDDGMEWTQKNSYSYNGNDWNQFDEFNFSYSIPVTHDDVILQSFQFNSEGTKYIRVLAYDDAGYSHQDTETVTVISGTAKEVTINVRDSSSNYFILTPTISVKRLDTNQTIVFYPETGSQKVIMYDGVQYNVTVSKLNYITKSVIYTPSGSYVLPVFLQPIYPEIPDKVVVEFEVRDFNTKTAIIGANINIRNSTGLDNQNGLTIGSGFLAFYVNPDDLYTATITKSGYQAVTTQFNISEDARLPVIYLYTTAVTTTPTPVKTTTPTPTKTTIPIPTGATPDEKIWISWSNIFGSEETLKWIIGICIIFAFAIAVGYVTKDSAGAGIGAGIGFVISIALKMIPVWTFFALLCVIGIVVAWKIIGDR